MTESRDLLRKDRVLPTLKQLVAEAIDRVKDGDADEIADKLAEVMPSIVDVLHSLVVSAESDKSERKWALETILAIFIRITTARLREVKTIVAKDVVKARREKSAASIAKAKALQKEADNEAKRLAKKDAAEARKVARAAKLKADRAQRTADQLPGEPSETTTVDFLTQLQQRQSETKQQQPDAEQRPITVQTPDQRQAEEIRNLQAIQRRIEEGY